MQAIIQPRLSNVLTFELFLTHAFSQHPFSADPPRQSTIATSNFVGIEARICWCERICLDYQRLAGLEISAEGAFSILAIDFSKMFISCRSFLTKILIQTTSFAHAHEPTMPIPQTAVVGGSFMHTAHIAAWRSLSLLQDSKHLVFLIFLESFGYFLHHTTPSVTFFLLEGRFIVL